MMMPFIWTLSHRFNGIDDDTIKDFRLFEGLSGHSCFRMRERGPQGSRGPQELLILWFAYWLLLIALANLLIAQLVKTFDSV